MGGGTVIPDAESLLDSVRTLLIRVWNAFNLRSPLPRAELEDCFRSFGLEDPLCELHLRKPNLRIILNKLEDIELSLMEVGSW